MGILRRITRQVLVDKWRHETTRLPDGTRAALILTDELNGGEVLGPTSILGESRRLSSLPPNTLPSEPDFSDSVDARTVLEPAIARLSRAHQEVVRMFYYKDLSIFEIAEQIGIAEGTVKSRLHWAIRRLRMAIDDSEDQ